MLELTRTSSSSMLKPSERYIHERGHTYSDESYRRPMEYIPVRPREYDVIDGERILLAPSADTRLPVEHGWVARPQVIERERGESLYERDGQLYYTGPHLYDTRMAPADTEYFNHRKSFN